MLWACFHFPQLALDAIRVDADPIDAQARGQQPPFAVIDGPQQRRHVVLANAAARNAGVRNGHAVAAAQTLCPRLTTAPRDETAERLALESIAAWAYRFSAEVSIAAPDTIFLEVGASLALFGGWPAIERRLRSEIATFGFAYSLTAAPAAAGARVLATHADGITIPSVATLVAALGAVPLAASGFDGKTVAALRGMGFRTLSDLFRLPRAELARRIGEASLDHLDRMRGLAAESLLRYRPPARYERRLEFSFGIESHGPLAFPLQRLIREFALFLIARDGGVQRFALVLGHERGASTRIEIGLLAPQRDATALLELARARLERIELPAPVHALTLRADDLPPLCPLHRDLFDAGRREALDWPALAERLCARLGEKALYGLACAADHRPELAWRPISARDAMRRSNATARADSGKSRVLSRQNIVDDNAAGHAIAVVIRKPKAKRGAPTLVPAIDAKTRPFWLLRRPNVLRGTITRILAGPERIESGWWDEDDQRRDYYVVETNLGQRAWAFVETGMPADRRAPWMLHGWFA
jgi:protein ImuB